METLCLRSRLSGSWALAIHALSLKLRAEADAHTRCGGLYADGLGCLLFHPPFAYSTAEECREVEVREHFISRWQVTRLLEKQFPPISGGLFIYFLGLGRLIAIYRYFRGQARDSSPPEKPYVPLLLPSSIQSARCLVSLFQPPTRMRTNALAGAHIAV